jgi:hypothetical protein
MPEPLELNGLDGANPLGFLAALGTLALCDRLDLNPRMAWRPYANSYRPTLSVTAIFEPLDFAERLLTAVSNHHADEPSVIFATDYVKWTDQAFRAFCTEAFEADQRRLDLDLCAALAAESGQPDDSAERSAFSFANGQSGKKLLYDCRRLATETSVPQFHRALFNLWRNDQQTRTLQWDPADFRPYALRDTDPGFKSPVKGEPAANLLAFYGLALLPTIPTSRGAQTTAMRGRGDPNDPRTVDQWTWPIWAAATTPDAVRSLIAMPLLHNDEIAPHDAMPRGLLAVFRAGKLRIGKPPTSRFYFAIPRQVI